MPATLFAQQPSYPETPRAIQHDTYHGVTIADPYRWMEDMASEETLAWVEAQDALTRRYADATPRRAALEERALELRTYASYGIPSRRQHRYFWSFSPVDQQHSILHMQEGLDGPARVVFDPNTHPLFQSEDGSLSPSRTSISRDGRRLAFQVSKGQSRWSPLRIMEFADGRLHDEVLHGVRGGPAWVPDGSGFYYIRYPVPKPGEELTAQLVNARVYYHRVGTPQERDVLVYERPQNPTWSYGVRVTHDGQALLISATPGGSFSGMTEYYFYKDLREERSEVRELFAGVAASFAYEGNRGDRFWFRTDHEAPRARLIEVTLGRTAPAHWKPLIPESEEVLNSISMTKDYLIARYTKDARPLVKVFDQQGRFQYAPDLPNLGSVSGLGDVPEGNEVFYAMNILYDPGIIYQLDVATGERDVFRAPELSYDPNDFESKQVFFTSRDGTRVPMYLVHKKGLRPGGSHPVFMYAYGAYSWVAWPWFRPELVAWLEMGGVFALPNIRGGGEYGEEWHQDGIKLKKQNGIDDYIAAAEWLIDNGYTTPERMIANGGSASGALAASALMQRPDLFGAGVIDIPNLDLLRSHLFPGGANRVPEYGSSEDPEEFKALYAYSPYQNIRAGTCYPPMLVTVGSKDEVAVPVHGYKFVAAMQAHQPCDNPVLLNVVWGAGHSYGVTNGQRAETWSHVFGFLIRALDLGADDGAASSMGGSE